MRVRNWLGAGQGEGMQCPGQSTSPDERAAPKPAAGGQGGKSGNCLRINERDLLLFPCALNHNSNSAAGCFARNGHRKLIDITIIITKIIIIIIIIIITSNVALCNTDMQQGRHSGVIKQKHQTQKISRIDRQIHDHGFLYK